MIQRCELQMVTKINKNGEKTWRTLESDIEGLELAWEKAEVAREEFGGRRADYRVIVTRS